MKPISKKEADRRLAEITAQQEMIHRICKARTSEEVSAAVCAEVDRLTKESNELNARIDTAVEYNLQIKGYVKYDEHVAWQHLKHEEINAEEAMSRNKILAECGSAARWIPYFETV